ncbi:thioredoxin family protein [Paracoccus saliphilus]|uniref:Thioredoxin family protein n=1 Tax=Paracoccus saliphilus TaxID=405559 RepID=A0AA46A528_9RHOB|nr:thioredoxin family protein [Paracoccus saliphilus]WCR04902.1 thioredoxin family protein [Paracoccus saliphilus]SIS72858.1 Thioredoxin-related protein [Paracoccus saliphilus]
MSFLRATLLTLALALPAHAVTLGDDGLYDEPWIRETFMDLREDLAEANAEGKRLLILIEQRGCIYCTKMHEEVFSDPAIAQLITDNYFVIQINMFGDIPVTDFDGTELPEKEMVNRWSAMFTPTMIFLPEEVGEGLTAAQASVATMPGAFGKGTTTALLEWVRDHGYESGENFQKYVQEKTAAPN